MRRWRHDNCGLKQLEAAAGIGPRVLRGSMKSVKEAVRNSVADLNRFGKVVQLTAFQPFESAIDGLNQCNSVSEGLMTDELRSFLELNLPKVKEGKKSKFSLVVAEPNLGSHISETIKITCQSGEFILELLRGVRLHFDKFIKDLKPGDLEKAQFGLAHSYSRSKVKFNVNRVDNMVIQAIFLLDTLDKDINSFSMRGMILMAFSVVGQDLTPVDLINVQLFAQRVGNCREFYFSPCLTTLWGRKMCEETEFLIKLSPLLSYAIQLAAGGFRALKTRGNTPKYGLIFHSSFIGRASAKNKGLMAGYLADKCSIASRIDCFAGAPLFLGRNYENKSRNDLNSTAKVLHLEKSIDVMKSAIESTQNKDGNTISCTQGLGEIDMWKWKKPPPVEAFAKKSIKKKSKPEDAPVAAANGDASEDAKSEKKKKKEERKMEHEQDLTPEKTNA
ncbi:Nucleolar protein 56 [Hibiscus syriacus]|uniref:Nucleolar protein 56 n=1 Tax=Hibiscus syriacus TaxID=106335 RepID=A0A6A3D3F7_HIBSY|nr:Nucleolar protein 56 [Hibiscus syriacus]